MVLLRRHGVPMALATGSNPGSSPLASLLLTMNMDVTRDAARALGLLDQIGTLEIGKRCDLAIWSVDALAELAYCIGFNPLHRRVWEGR